MKKKICAAVRIGFFLVLCCAALVCATRLTTLKDSEKRVRPFLADAKDVDVLFFGDSLIYYGIYPMDLYSHYGITAYNLGGSNCTLPLACAVMKNALEYANPKVAVIGLQDVELANALPRTERVHTALDGFPMTRTKAETLLLMNAADEKETQTLRSEMFFPLIKYHSRWSQLTADDLHPELNTEKGTAMRVHVSDPMEYTLLEEEEFAPEEGPGYAALREMIALCETRGIRVLLIQMPHPLSEDSQRATNTAAAIGEEYGIDTIDFAAMDQVADYYTDCYDPGGHMNPSGARKVTDYLGDYLSRNFDLPDHRGEAGFEHWETEREAYLQKKLSVFTDGADSFRCRLMLLHDLDFSLVLTLKDGFDYSAGVRTKETLQNIARANVLEGDEFASGELKPLESLGDAAREKLPYTLIVDRAAGQILETYGECEEEFETSFGIVFTRMSDWRMDLSLTPEDGEETYYFESEDEQAADVRVLLIDRQTGEPVLAYAFNQEEATP